MKEFNVVGKSEIKLDALDKALGKAKFGADYKMENMLVAKVLRSEVSHAMVKNIDIVEAEKTPGVQAILTAKDIPGFNGHGIILKDEPVLVEDRIRKHGDPLVLVVAENDESAEAAMSKIKVDLEELPGVFDPIEAMKPDAPKVYEKGNILSVRKIRKGDVEKAFASCDVIVEEHFTTQRQEHAYIEPEVGLAYMSGDVLEMYVSTQNTHFDRDEVARVCKLPINKVRVVQVTTGGGFGGKLDISVQCYLALAVLKTGRPVKMVYTREESIISSTKRHPYVIDYKMGATKDGKIQAVKAHIVGDTGAYASYGPGVLTRAGVHATGPYEVPNVWVDAYAVYTNNPTAGAMRGFGVPQIAFAHEQQIDKIAEALNMDPFEIRLINALQVGSVTTTGQVLESGVGIKKTIEAAREKLEQHNNE